LEGEIVMAKLVVIYDQPKDQEGFENYYFNVHIPLAQKLPHIKAAEVHRVLQAQNTAEQPYLFAELIFETPQELTQALSSAEGRDVQGDVINLMPFLHKPPVILITD
jgi:uncharacterized protein (TIGR02118 family)